MDKSAQVIRHKQPYIPNRQRAITNAKIATVKDGKRIVKEYQSGQPLEGRIV